MSRFNMAKIVHLVCRRWSSANVCWGKEIQRPDSGSMRKIVSDRLSIIDVRHKCGDSGREPAKICYPCSSLMPLLNKWGGGWSREKSDLPKSSSQKEGDSLELCCPIWWPLATCGDLSLEMQLVWIKMYIYKTLNGFWRLNRKYLINIFILIPCWNANILDILSWINCINKLMSPVSFYFLKMWLLENFKLHLWLTLHFCETALC